MSKTSFADLDKALEAAATAAPEAAPTPTAITPAPSAEIVPDSFFGNEGLEGDVDAAGIQVPWIHLVHSVGDLSAKFQAGSLLYNGEVVLKLPLEAVVLRLKNYVIEDVPFQDREEGQRMRTFENEAEARQAGFAMSWERKDLGKDRDYCTPCADIDLLVKGYPEIAELCPLDFNGEPYLIARHRTKGVNHKLAAGRVISAAAFNRGKPLTAFRWEFTAKRGLEGKNHVWRSYLTQKSKNSEEFVTWARQLL